ncbi:uncharacterized protein [Bemisia tabaci]|uniref:uncharacterized protein n=1 Tax=Bemisia tabaci TaxID=7038 RepID=UPI003B27C000
MLTYPPMQTANTTSLNNLIHSLNDSVEALKNLKFEKLDDFILLNIGLKKLPFHVRRLFENEVKGADVPTFKEFMDFLRKQAKIAELTQTSNKDEKPKTQPPKTKVYLNSNSKNRDCPVCEGSHSIYACEEFKRFPVHARIERVKSLKRCRRCLGAHEDECRSKFACKECNQKTHHTLLHSNKTSSSNSAFTQHGSTSEENFDDQKSSSMLTNLQATSTDHQDYTALLGTALIAVKDINGKYQHMRVILDSGAMSSFVSADCAKRLGLPLLPDNTCISGLADSQVNSLGAIDCLVKPRQTDEPKLMVRTIVIPVITENLPCVKISDKVRKFWSKLDLADPSFDDTNTKIDMLLGSEVFVRIISSQKKITKDLGHALQSIYGWVLMGKVPTEKKPKKQTTFIMTENGENSLKEVLTKFWETEEPCHTSPISPEDEKCEALYKELHYRESSGQYVVPLLLKVPNPVLTGSYNLAKKRLNSVQTRLKKLPEVHKKYKDFMEEYENLQHMRPADVHGRAKYYIPHHSVIKETSLTTKLRVVFDASMPTTTGLSLNQVLYTGPKLQASIIDLVIKFRSHRVAFKTDLCKMFRQILIRPEDRQFQHILWQPTDDGPVMDYELLTVTYGTGSAPFLANRTLKQLVLDENKDFSEAACRVVDEDTYVDDSLSGADSIPEVIELRDELYQLLSRGHFHPRQWASSHPEALAGLPEADIALPSESAIHIEHVTDLTAESFIAALDRFTSRRGLCQEMYSDNGTNYVGAERQLNELYKILEEGDEWAKIKSQLAERQITWRHSPPSGPHFNGLSEAAIKAVKFHLHRVIGNEKLTMDQFLTLLCKIEAILNSRPLCPISADTEELSALTPAHFMIGAPLLSLPEYNWTLTPSNRLSQWQAIQKMSQHFWERWSAEYLTTLQARQKWTAETDSLKVGDIVIVKEDNLPPLSWALARVTARHQEPITFRAWPQSESEIRTCADQ